MPPLSSPLTASSSLVYPHLLHLHLRSLYSVYASLVPSHGASTSGDRYVFYATDVGNAAYLGVLNLSSLQLSVRPVPQLSDWTEMACDSSTYALAPPPARIFFA